MIETFDIDGERRPVSDNPREITARQQRDDRPLSQNAAYSMPQPHRPQSALYVGFALNTLRETCRR